MNSGQYAKEDDSYDSQKQIKKIREINKLEIILNNNFSKENARTLFEVLKDYFKEYPKERENTIRLPKCYEYLSDYFENWFDLKELMKKLNPLLLKPASK